MEETPVQLDGDLWSRKPGMRTGPAETDRRSTIQETGEPGGGN